MADEAQVWLIYGLAATGLVFLALFMWNLACAPYRLECEDHARTKATLEAAQKERLDERRGEPPTASAEPTWDVWRSRSRFTVLEAAYLMAGVEPSKEEATGPVSAFLQELKWAVMEDRLITEIGEMSRRLRNLRHQSAKALGGTTPSGMTSMADDVSEGEVVRPEVFFSYLREQEGNERAQHALAMLAGDR